MNLPRLAIANAHFVTPSLAIGGDLAFEPARASAQAQDLVDNGITHVLDVRQEADDYETWAAHASISYLWDGIDDAGQRVPGEWFEGVAAWATAAIDQGGVVLTHCHMGINRGPSAGYAVLLAQGWDPVDAMQAIRMARPIAAVGYAEDALEWHLDRIGATSHEREEARDRLAHWRWENPHDTVRIIRSIRESEWDDLSRLLS